MGSRTRISLFILLIIGLHAVPVLSYQGERQTRWPFLAWTMYARSFPRGPMVVVTGRLLATSASGKEEEITPQLVGLPTPGYRQTYLAPLLRGDSTPVDGLIQRLNRERHDPVVQLRLEGERLILADTGVVREALPALTFRAHPSGSN
jgi:hypothetical protein